MALLLFVDFIFFLSFMRLQVIKMLLSQQSFVKQFIIFLSSQSNLNDSAVEIVHIFPFHRSVQAMINSLYCKYFCAHGVLETSHKWYLFLISIKYQQFTSIFAISSQQNLHPSWKHVLIIAYGELFVHLQRKVLLLLVHFLMPNVHTYFHLSIAGKLFQIVE